MTQDIFANDPLQDSTFQHDWGMQGSNLDPNQYDNTLHSTPDMQDISSLNAPHLDNLQPHQPFDLGGADLGNLGDLGGGHSLDVSDWNPSDLNELSYQHPNVSDWNPSDLNQLSYGHPNVSDWNPSDLNQLSYGHPNMHEPFDLTSLSHDPVNPYDSSHLSPTSGDYSSHDGLGGIQNDGHHDPFAMTGQPVSLHSTRTDSSPYTTIDDDGRVYKHTSNHSSRDWVGRIKKHKVYTWRGDYLGKADLDGRVYDSHKHCVGWVDTNGHVYNEAGVQVHETTRGVAGAAAYLLFVYHGGLT